MTQQRWSAQLLGAQQRARERRPPKCHRAESKQKQPQLSALQTQTLPGSPHNSVSGLAMALQGSACSWCAANGELILLPPPSTSPCLHSRCQHCARVQHPCVEQWAQMCSMLTTSGACTMFGCVSLLPSPLMGPCSSRLLPRAPTHFLRGEKLWQQLPCPCAHLAVGSKSSCWHWESRWPS